jgi:hypothetical protein
MDVFGNPHEALEGIGRDREHPQTECRHHREVGVQVSVTLGDALPCQAVNAGGGCRPPWNPR